MTALTAREPLLRNKENGTRSKSRFSTAPPAYAAAQPQPPCLPRVTTNAT